MKARWWIMWGLLPLILLPCGIQADEQSPQKPEDLRQEISELKQLTQELSNRLAAVEERLAQLEEQMAQPAEPTGAMRPLGKEFEVDSNGIIWRKGAQGRRGKPVGLWGVNGRSPLALPTQQR